MSNSLVGVHCVSPTLNNIMFLYLSLLLRFQGAFLGSVCGLAFGLWVSVGKILFASGVENLPVGMCMINLTTTSTVSYPLTTEQIIEQK